MKWGFLLCFNVNFRPAWTLCLRSRLTGRSLLTVDIGGGLSTSYTEAAEPEEFAYAYYRKLLNEAVPELFTGKYRIMTEFGRSLTLKAGKTLTRNGIICLKIWQ
jgi:diaminopimelate decarboxylase